MRLVLDSGLFDPEWYAATAGCSTDPEAAARHYLAGGWRKGHTAHPMFDHRHLLKRYESVVGDRNPLVAYLTDRRLARASTQPLMAYRLYQQAHPEASRHPGGVTRHYLERGAPQGFQPVDWYTPDPGSEPEGLADWLRARRREWSGRRALTTSPWSREAPVTAPAASPTPRPADGGDGPLVSVVLPSGPGTPGLADSLASVLHQDLSDLEVLLVHPTDHTEAVERATEGLLEGRVRRIAVDEAAQSAALAAGVAAASGRWVAFALPTTQWSPEHLSTTLARAESAGADAATDVVERLDRDGTAWYCRGPATRARSLVAPQLHLAGLVVRRELLLELGGVDASVRRAAAHHLELQLTARAEVPLLARVGVRTSAAKEQELRDAVPLRERPRLDLENLDSWDHVVVQRHVVDWSSIGPGEPGLVSVVIPTHADYQLTQRAVARVVEADALAWEAWDSEGGAESTPPPRVEVVVVDNGCPADEAVALDSLPLQFPAVRVVHEPVNRGYALGNNIGVAASRGAVVVFLNNDTEVRPGWLEPLVTALADPGVHGAQSLLVYPSGAIQSAGVAFPSCGGTPHEFLQGFPVEDARGVDRLPLRACTGASLAMRREDVARVGGFDPIFRNGMEDVDLGLRMEQLRPGRFTTRPDSVVLHHESRAPGRFDRSLVNRRLYLDRHRGSAPRDDESLWSAAGFEVVGHRVRHVIDKDRRLSTPQPVLRRRTETTTVEERLPSLRWALKNPAPAGPEAERWGDTHFIRRLAAALERLGQQVVIDHRPEFERSTGYLDDVVLVLRGVAPYTPVYGQVSMCWLISHPEMMSRREAESYDRVFAASRTWSASASAEWGVRIEPLLQATDPELFHPDLARPDTGHSLLFLGSSRRVLRPLVGAAVEQGLPLSIIGHQWEGLVPERYVKSEYLAHEAIGTEYRRAGIVLNDHWEDMRVAGFLSNRLFDAVACGARVVSDDVAGIDGLFGRSVQVVRDPAELSAVVNAGDLDAVFGTDEERRETAKRIHRDHSFDARARALLEAAVEVRRSQGPDGAHGA